MKLLLCTLIEPPNPSTLGQDILIAVCSRKLSDLSSLNARDEAAAHEQKENASRRNVSRGLYFVFHKLSINSAAVYKLILKNTICVCECDYSIWPVLMMLIYWGGGPYIR